MARTITKNLNMTTYRVRICRTWKGLTAGDLISGAAVAPTAAGTLQIMTSRLPGYILTLTEDDQLVLDASPSACCRMLLSGIELARMKELAAECEAGYAAKEVE